MPIKIVAPDFDQLYLKSILHYDPDTGIFTWLAALSDRIRVGNHAGYRRPDGYLLIRINKQTYRAHRLAWMYVHGRWPTNQIDHINCDPRDNRIVNLREATQSQNNMNVGARRTNTSGYKGVSWHKAHNKWRAVIQVNGKHKHLGLFATAEEAAAVHDATAKAIYGEFAGTA